MSPSDLARALLAGCLLLAAASKALDGGEGFVRSLARFGVLPPGAERGAARAVIASEAVAGILLLSPARTLGALLAALLAAGFAWAVSSALARGDLFACGCFGKLPSPAVGPWLLALDLGLLGAATALAAERLAGPGWREIGDPTGRLLAVVAATVVLGLALQSARSAFLPGFRAGLPEGERPPDVAVRTASGDEVRVRDLAVLAGGGAVLLFVHGGCPACRRLLGGLDAFPGGLPVFVVGGAGEDAAALAARFSLDPRRTIGGRGAADLRRHLRIPGSPAAVALGRGRVRGTAFPAGPSVLPELAERAAGRPAAPGPRPVVPEPGVAS